MSHHDIVPFGKYKGQPIERLLTDVEYLQWCQQTGVLDRYPWLQVMIVSGQPKEDQPTPAHNRLQERFADWEYCRAVLRCLGVDARPVPSGFETWAAVRGALFERMKAETALPPQGKYEDSWVYDQRVIKAASPALRAVFDFSDGRDVERDFEVCGWDTILRCGGGRQYERSVNIELKPIVGDDYPAIVRQVDRRIARAPSWFAGGRAVVAYDQWSAGVSVATVQAMYPRITWCELPAARLRPPAATQAAGQKFNDSVGVQGGQAV